MHRGLVDQADKFKKDVASRDKSQYKVITREQLVVGFPIDEGVLAFQQAYDEAIVSPAYGIWDLTESELCPNYLQKFLRSPSALAYYKAKLQGTTARRRSLPNPVFLELEVPLPPLPEQRRIAAILDHADALRVKRHETAQRLLALTQSVFVALFGDPRLGDAQDSRTLDEVTKFVAGGTLPPGYGFEGQEGGHLLLKVSDLNRPGNERMVTNGQIWSPVAGAKASTCPEGSVVFPKRGGAIATNKKRVTGRSCVLDPNLMAVTPQDHVVTTEYLLAWFSFLDLSSIASGSSVPQLNKRDLAPLKICVPPIDQQRTFSSVVQCVNDLSERLSDSASRLDSLFSSLQSRAFRGEL